MYHIRKKSPIILMYHSRAVYVNLRSAAGKEKRIATLPILLPLCGNAVTAMW
jgi:hypothetical protein